MKKINFLAMTGALAGVMMMGACNVNDDIADNADNGAVRFTAGIAHEAPATRAAGTTWAASDDIGIFMVGHRGTTVVMDATNKQYTTPGSGTFTAVPGDEIYYPQTGAVDFIAYYPYASSVTAIGDNISVDVAGTQTTASQAGIDLLWAKADNSGNGYDKDTSGNPALSFDHKLAKIVMNCTAEANVGITNFDNVTVSIAGMNTENTLTLSDGTLGTPETVAAITPRKIATADTFMASYDAIILPDSYLDDEVTVTFTTGGGQTFTWTLEADDAVFAGGNEYTYDVTLISTGTGGVKVTGTINPWITSGNNRGGVTAE